MESVQAPNKLRARWQRSMIQRTWRASWLAQSEVREAFTRRNQLPWNVHSLGSISPRGNSNHLPR
jgi:hypothetical protein